MVGTKYIGRFLIQEVLVFNYDFNPKQEKKDGRPMPRQHERIPLSAGELKKEEQWKKKEEDHKKNDSCINQITPSKESS